MKLTKQETWNRIWPVLGTRYKRDGTFLNYRTPFELLIAVILSAQTTDDGVNKVTEKLFRKFNTPSKLAAAKMSDITAIIRPVGYFNAKGRYIQNTAKIIMKNFEGKVPMNEEDLRTLPGVGRKTAVVVLSHVGDANFGIPVDTHVIRFAHRFGLSKSKNPDQIERDLCELIPRKNWKKAAYAIKEYGRQEGRARGYDKNVDPLHKK